MPTPLMALYRGVFVDPKFESELGGRASEASDGSELGEGGQCGRPRQPGKLGIKPPARVCLRGIRAEWPVIFQVAAAPMKLSLFL